MALSPHHTINRFRSVQLKDVLKEVFAQVILMLNHSEHLGLKEVYVGTKIEGQYKSLHLYMGNNKGTSKKRIVKIIRRVVVLYPAGSQCRTNRYVS